MMSERISKVGFIGLGSMGGKQARELAKLDVPLTVFDSESVALHRFDGLARLADDVAAVGVDADIVGICVQNDEQVLACVEPLLSSMKSGSVLMIHSTVKPETVMSIAARMAENAIIVIDAPVTRTEAVEDGPFVFCMVGGDEAVMRRVQPALDAFSTNTMYVGPLGSAMALKICNNLVSWGGILLGLEAFRVAQASDVPLDKLAAVMDRNGVMSPPMKAIVNFMRDPGDATGRNLMRVQADIGEKDFTLAKTLAMKVGEAAPISESMRAIVKRAILDICDS
jgi:3-hydroxyisobutyrate dehydrogenase